MKLEDLCLFKYIDQFEEEELGWHRDSHPIMQSEFAIYTKMLDKTFVVLKQCRNAIGQRIRGPSPLI